MSCSVCPTLNTNTCPAPDIGTMLMTTVLSSLLGSVCNLGNTTGKYPPNAVGKLNATYDYIVVGSGSAGSTVASRLTEDPDVTVLLLEAGGDPTLTSEVCQFYVYLPNSPLSWNYTTEPQSEACKGTIGGRCYWPRGKVLGGSSTINAMIYQRGSSHDYNGWASRGNDGWSFSAVLPYFRKSEQQTSPNILSYNDALLYHGVNGNLAVSSFTPANLVPALKQGATASNYRIVDDFARDDLLGFGLTQGTVRNGTRCSAAKAFLGPAAGRSNLHVLRGAFATHILMNPLTKTALGVRFQTGDSTNEIPATKEVIVSAGTVNSPQLLMLSGIGPEDHLREMGISPIIKDLPVGRSLQDHLAYYGLTYCFNKSLSHRPISDMTSAIIEYLRQSTGPLGHIGYLAYLGFVKSEGAAYNESYPDFQVSYTLVTSENASIDLLSNLNHFGKEIKDALFVLTRDCDIVIPIIILLHPYSKGSITLRSKTPSDMPVIDPRYLTDERDVSTFLEAIELMTILGTNVPGVKSVQDMPLSVCQDYNTTKEDYRRCLLRYVTTTFYHPVGTCKMGPSSDKSSVVDPDLRVHGIQKLRVIDASVMPTLPSGTINAPTIMVAEKGSDIIKKQNNETN